MSWRVPRYGIYNEIRGLVPEQGDNLETAGRLNDDRGSLLHHGAPDGTPFAAWSVRYNRGTGTLRPITQVYVPPGHTLDTVGQFKVDAADDLAFTLNVTVLADFNPAPNREGFGFNWAGTVGDNTQQYVRIFVGGGAGVEHGCGEIILTDMQATTRGPAQGWRDESRANRLLFEKESGASVSLALGPDRRSIGYDYRDIKDAGDHALLKALWQECGTYRPFLLDPAYTVDAAGDPVTPVWMELERDPTISEDTPIPTLNTFQQARWDLDMLEHL